MRKSELLQSLEITSGSKGLSNYLIGQVSLEEILKIGNNKRPFDVILAGTIPPNPGELVKSEKLKTLLNELKEIYEYIIIDTAPIGLVGDTYALTNVSDANLFIVRQNKTQKAFLKNVMEQIKQDNVPNIYVVLNGVDVKNNQNYTYHGYLRRNYYNKQGKKAEYYYNYYEDKT